MRFGNRLARVILDVVAVAVFSFDLSQVWFNAIVALRSDDGGEAFSRVGERPVVSLPIRQNVDQGHPRGFFEPPNIVKRGDAFSLIRAGAEGWQKAGTCLFRADDLARPETWRFFDGEGYPQTSTPIQTT